MVDEGRPAVYQLILSYSWRLGTVSFIHVLLLRTPTNDIRWSMHLHKDGDQPNSYNTYINLSNPITRKSTSKLAILPSLRATGPTGLKVWKPPNNCLQISLIRTFLANTLETWEDRRFNMLFCWLGSINELSIYANWFMLISGRHLYE